MKKSLILLLTSILAGCATFIKPPSEKVMRRGVHDGKYDYFLSEAIRNKYIGETATAVGLFEKCIETDPGRAVPYYELSMVYSSMGMGQKALSMAKKAATIDKMNYWYQLACGSLYNQYNQKDSALYFFYRALEADQERMELKSAIAAIHADRNEFRKADSILMIIDDAGLLSGDLLYTLVNGLIEEGDAEEAAKRTIKYLKQDPSEVRYQALLAEIYIKDRKYNKGDSIYNEIIKRNPEDAESQVYVLLNYLRKREYGPANFFLNSVFSSNRLDRNFKVSVAREVLKDSVYIKDQQVTFGEKLAILEELYREDEEILSLRPQLYELNGLNSEAIMRYEVILETVKPGLYFKERLIFLYAEARDYEKLYNLASVYSKENNRSIIGKIYYAISAMETGRFDVADEELKKAMILAGNDDIMRAQVFSLMADLKYRTKDSVSAFKYFEEALGINPGDIAVMNNYAYYLAEENADLEKALRLARVVIAKEPGNATYLDTHAWVLYKMKKPGEALREIQKALKAEEQNDPEILEHTGYIYRDLKKCDEAVKYWNEALKKDSSKTTLLNEIEKCTKE